MTFRDSLIAMAGDEYKLDVRPRGRWRTLGKQFRRPHWATAKYAVAHSFQTTYRGM
jgi:hypothetical protein